MASSLYRPAVGGRGDRRTHSPRTPLMLICDTGPALAALDAADRDHALAPTDRNYLDRLGYPSENDFSRLGH